MARGDDVRRERAWCPRSDGGCGAEFWRDKGSRRRKCVKCSPPRASSRAGDLQPVGGPVGGSDAYGDPEGGGGASVAAVGPVEASVVAELTSRKRLDTPQGQLAVLLAHQMESRQHSGSQLAVMAEKLNQTLALALRGAPAVADAVDEMTERRRRRAAGA